MSEIAAGFWPCKVISGFYGDVETKPNVFIPTVRINVEITEGEAKGTRQTYEEAVNNKQAPYIMRSCKAVGWKCQSLKTLAADVDAWIKATGGMSTVEIKHMVRKTGPKAGTIWAKANSIGRGPRPIKESSQENLNDSDALMRAALAEEAERYGTQGNGAPPHDDIPPPDDDSIPFASASMAHDRVTAQIAKVLR